MTTTLAYLPPIQQIPAKHLRTDTRRYLRYAELSMCDADSPTCPHTYGVRPWSSSAIATESCRPTACFREWQCFPTWAGGSPTIVHCSFYIVHCWTFTFSAKERDSETGLSYFGSRYYSSDLSIWLSVDPMSDKYASLSPYVYCADNPVKLVDPNGEEVYIVGDFDNKNAIVDILSKYFENIDVGYDEGTGKLKIVKGTAQTDDELAFANAVNDTKIQVNLEIGDSQNTGRKTSNGEDLIVEGAGGFLGNTISYNSKEHTKENIVKVYTSQYLSIDAMERLYYEKDWGKLINHEITESFQGGLISSTTNVPGRNENGVINSDIYNQAHAAATPQPFTIGASWLHH